MTPRVLMPGDSVGREFYLLAPVIAVVKIQRAQWLGPPTEITPPGVLVVRPAVFDADVETVIRGSLPKGPIRFYFFANSFSTHGYTTVFSWMNPGKRYIVFLRHDGQVLRTMGDVDTMNLRVLGGRRDRIEIDGNADWENNPAPAIAFELLTPSTDYEVGFAQDLPYEQSMAGWFAPAGDVVRMLRKLLRHPDRSIREYACLKLALAYQYRDPCLPGLIHAGDAYVRQQAASLIHGRLAAGPALIEALKNDPLSLSVSGRSEDLAGDLELFTFDLDGKVRVAACAALRRLFPLREFNRCPGPVATRVESSRGQQRLAAAPPSFTPTAPITTAY